MQNMRICRISTAFVPPWSGLGPGPYELSRAQAQSGHQLTVITRYADDCAAFDRGADFEIHRIRTRRSLSFSFLAAMKFLRLHRRQPFDVVHNHGESAIGLLMLRKLLPLRTPVVSSVHIVRRSQYRKLGEVMESHRTVAPGRLTAPESAMELDQKSKTLFYEKLYFKLSDALATVNSNLGREIAEEYGISEKVFTIFNGVAVSEFPDDNREADRREIKAALGCEELILFVGRLNGRKGEFDLIEAMGRVREARPGVKLLIVGQGPARAAAISAVRDRNLEDTVAFVQNLPRNELRRYYSASDVFTLPSWSEGLPKVLLEAMVSGAAAVVSNIPAHRELVTHGETGYLFETGDVEDLARAVIGALGDHRRPAVTGRAADLVREKFTWSAVARRLDDVYNAVLA